MFCDLCRFDDNKYCSAAEGREVATGLRFDHYIDLRPYVAIQSSGSPRTQPNAEDHP